MLIKRPNDIAFSDVTPKDLYVNRRQFLSTASAVALGALAGVLLAREERGGAHDREQRGGTVRHATQHA